MLTYGSAGIGREPDHDGSEVARVEEPTVSVVVPTFNRADLLGRAVASALTQTRQDIEVLVVDDGSTDETASVVADFRDPRVRLIRHEKTLGACAARNTGIRAAGGTYIAFLDSDDEWAPTKLDRQIAALENSDLPMAGMVTCGEETTRSDGQSSILLPRRKGWIFHDLLRQRHIGCRTSNLLVRKSILEKHDIRFDTNLAARQDWDFVAQIARVCQMEIVRERLSTIHLHDGERVWTPHRAVLAGRYLHDKYHADLTRSRRAHCQFHLRTALTCIADGDKAEARAQIKGALHARPWSILSYLWLLLHLLQHEGRPPSLMQRIGIKLLRPLTF
jgi:glycosyltransferase involved in cell wall biosynthesis